MAQSIPATTNPFKYAFGMGISNNATTPDEQVDVAVGQVRDSNDLLDLELTSSVTIDATTTGANGLDTGSLAASTLYKVFCIGDSNRRKTTACILTLASNSAPTMPFGYDSQRLIGYMATDGTSDFLAMYQYGNGNMRTMRYDAPQSALAAGTATAYTAVALTAMVPADENIDVKLNYSFTPNAASDTFELTPGNGTGDGFVGTGQVAAVVISGAADMMAKVTSNVPEVDYKVSVGTASLDLNVAGYNFAI